MYVWNSGVVRSGLKLQILEEVGKWVMIESEGAHGWYPLGGRAD